MAPPAATEAAGLEVAGSLALPAGLALAAAAALAAGFAAVLAAALLALGAAAGAPPHAARKPAKMRTNEFRRVIACLLS